MMRIVLFLLIVVAVSACKEITYPEPQPKGKKSLSKIPDEFLGVFSSKENKDTVIIRSNGFFTAEENKKDQMLLGDSLILRHYKGLYVLSHANKTNIPDWSVALLQRLPNGDVELQLMPSQEKTFKELAQKVSTITPIDSIERSGEKLYRINPTPKQLLQLVKKGYFSDKVVLKRIR